MSWKTSCVSPPASPPEAGGAPLPFVFVDRSLGRLQVPRLLREAGVELITLAEYYGIPADETVDDVTWLADSAQRGWVAFMKDARIRRRPAERRAIQMHRARCFCITNMNLPSAEMAQRYLDNLAAIAWAAREPGPFMYAVHANRIERLGVDGPADAARRELGRGRS